MSQITTVKGQAFDSVVKPGETELTDAAGIPFTPENRDRHGSEAAPTGIDAAPRPYSGAGVDIDSTDMPEDGIIAVHDTDEDILAGERARKISDIPPPSDESRDRS